MTLTIWVCPNCGNYYGSSDTGDLSTQWNTDKKNQKTFRRSRCPTRTCAVEDIHRVPVRVEV